MDAPREQMDENGVTKNLILSKINKSLFNNIGEK